MLASLTDLFPPATPPLRRGGRLISSSSSSSRQTTAAAAAGAAQHGAVAPFAARRAPDGSANNILELNEFRRGVGLCIYRADGLVFAARRMDDPQQSWQMPQVGGNCPPQLRPA